MIEAWGAWWVRRVGGVPASLSAIGLAIGLMLVVMAPSCNGRILFDPNGCDENYECVLPNLYCDVAAATCVPCMADVHCLSLGIGLVRCDMALHRCVACGVDSDCGTGRACRNTRCVTPCQDDSVCPVATPHCEGPVGFCVLCESDNNACASASAPGPICDESAGLCVSCLSDANCGGTNPRCDTVTGRCVECLRSEDCRGSTPLCNPATNRCVPRP